MKQVEIKHESNGTFLHNSVGMVASMEAGYQEIRNQHAIELQRAINSHDALIAALEYCLPRVHKHLAKRSELVKASNALASAKS